MGEWCFALRFPKSHTESVDNSTLIDESGGTKALTCLLEAGVSVSEAAKRVSQHFGIPKKIVYQLALNISGKKIKEGG